MYKKSTKNTMPDYWTAFSAKFIKVEFSYIIAESKAMDETRTSTVLANHKGEGSETETGKQKRKRNSSSLSYVAVIAHAILSSPRQRLPLCEIYKFIEEHHPEFTENRARWKNTVRHNLSLHDCFLRGEVAFNKKGCNWRIHPSFLAEFTRGDFSRHKFSQSPSLSLDSVYGTSHGAHLSVSVTSPCYVCESTRRVLPSHGQLQFQRQEVQYSQIPHLLWRPWAH